LSYTTVSTAIYTLSLHDALPISKIAIRREGKPYARRRRGRACRFISCVRNKSRKFADPPVLFPVINRENIPRILRARSGAAVRLDRKSTRLNSSHEWISYAVFCL